MHINARIYPRNGFDFVVRDILSMAIRTTQFISLAAGSCFISFALTKKKMQQNKSKQAFSTVG